MEETETSVAEADEARGERESALSRKEKRKAFKKAKRALLRRQQAAEASKIEEQEQVDPEELKKQQELEAMEQKKHDEEEKAWLEREEQARKEAALRLVNAEEKAHQAAENGGTCLVEDNLVWIGNSITITKTKPSGMSTARVEAKDRPTSNPPPPPQLAKGDTYESFDQDPTFGTEQDKNFCSFHYKTGACRFSNTCRRAHVYPQKSCTLLMKNMYTGPGLAWEHDEALEYTDKEVEQHYEEFYEDVHSEFLKFGELVNFKVARNGAAHLRGNVYVHFKHEECAIAARNAFLGRFFGGRQIMPEFVGVKKWKQALCGVYMRNLQGCSHGVSCNFLHCFRNPGGDYEWADWDSPAPRSWQKKMATLFGYQYEEPEDGRKSDEEEKEERSRCRSQDRSGRSKHERERSRSRDDRGNRDWDEGSARHRDRSSRRVDVDETRSRSRDERKNRECDEDSGRRRDRSSRRDDVDERRNRSRDERSEYTGRHRDRSSRRDDGDERRSSRHQDPELEDGEGRDSRKHRGKHEDDHAGDRKRSSSKREGGYDEASSSSRSKRQRSYDEYTENSKSRNQKISDDEYERWQGS